MRHRAFTQTDFCLSISFFIHWILYFSIANCEMAIWFRCVCVYLLYLLNFVEQSISGHWIHKWCDNFVNTLTHSLALSHAQLKFVQVNKMEHSILISTWNCSQSLPIFICWESKRNKSISSSMSKWNYTIICVSMGEGDERISAAKLKLLNRF